MPLEFSNLKFNVCSALLQVREEFCTAICENLERLSTMPSAPKNELLFPLKTLRIVLAEVEELSPLLLQRLSVPILEFFVKCVNCSIYLMHYIKLFSL